MTAGGTTVSVVLNLGDMLVSVKFPAPSGQGELGEAQARVTALRHARRVLAIAQQELE